MENKAYMGAGLIWGRSGQNDDILILLIWKSFLSLSTASKLWTLPKLGLVGRGYKWQLQAESGSQVLVGQHSIYKTYLNELSTLKDWKISYETFYFWLLTKNLENLAAQPHPVIVGWSGGPTLPLDETYSFPVSTVSIQFASLIYVTCLTL